MVSGMLQAAEVQGSIVKKLRQVVEGQNKINLQFGVAFKRLFKVSLTQDKIKFRVSALP